MIQYELIVKKTSAEIQERLNNLQTQGERLENLTPRIQILNEKVEQSRQNIKLQYEQANGKLLKLLTEIEDTKQKVDQVIKDIEGKFTLIGDQEDLPNFANRDDLNDAFENAKSLFEFRLVEIEQQADQICLAISQMDATNPGSNKKPPVNIILDKLGKEMEEEDGSDDDIHL